MLQHYAHPLGLRSEGEVGEHLILLHDPRSILNHYFLLVTLKQFQTQRVRKFHECHLVRGARLEIPYGFIIWVRIRRSHIMAEGETGDEVSHRVVLLSPLIIFPGALINGSVKHARVIQGVILVAVESHHTTVLKVTHGSLVSRTILIQHRFQIHNVIQVKLGVFHRKFLKYHVILCKCTCLICE